MFLFSIGITRGKWGTLLSNLLSFKRDYDGNRPVSEVLPEVAAQNPERYRNVGMRDLGDEMFEYLRTKRPGDKLNQAYEHLPRPDMTPREAYEMLVAGDVEPVPVDKLAKRTAANSIMPYPPGIPMLMSGENFGKEGSPHISYLQGLHSWEQAFPGFGHVTEGAEIMHGEYQVLCVR
jgi:arginine decarboxylase